MLTDQDTDPASETGRPAVPEAGEDVEDALQENAPEEAVSETERAERDDAAEESPASEDKVQRRIDRITAKRREAEERAERAEAELRRYREEQAEKELDAYKGMPDAFVVQALKPSERAEFAGAGKNAEKFAAEADAWAKGLQDGFTTADGREFSAEQCRRFYRGALMDQARAEARLGALRELGADRLRAHLRKSGFRVEDSEDSAETSAPSERPKVAVKPSAAPKRMAAPPMKAPGQGSGKVEASSPPRKAIASEEDAREFLGLDLD